MYRYDKRGIRVKKFFMSVIVFISISLGSIVLYKFYFEKQENRQISRVEPEMQRVSQEVELSLQGKDITKTIEGTINTVVGISKIKNNGTSIFGVDNTSKLGIGTGVIISENGYVLTNEHVVGQKFSSCYITIENGSRYKGTVVWADTGLDLAIVKTELKGLKSIKIGDSDSVKIAQPVYAIGNPIGIEFQRTVTKGIVSGKDRTIRIEENVYMEDLIQTDATINPGNSGGPLINEEGEMIAINSVKISSAEGIGFAIPINIVKPVIERIIEDGSFQEPYLGIFDYDKAVIPYLEDGGNFEKGVYVAQVDLAGPAKNTGLKIGDIITKIDDVEINKMSDLKKYIYTKNPKEEVILTAYRNNKAMEFKITLGTK